MVTCSHDSLLFIGYPRASNVVLSVVIFKVIAIKIYAGLEMN